MSRRLPGSLLLILLALGFLYARPAWAESGVDQVGNVLVRVSPLTLLLENEVTIKVGDFTCHLVNGVDPSSQCSNLPPGEYEISAVLAGYFTVPPSYPLVIPGDPEDEEEASTVASVAHAPDAMDQEGEFLFKFYQIRNEMYMPTVQVGK